jgi:hypothetical protein
MHEWSINHHKIALASYKCNLLMINSNSSQVTHPDHILIAYPDLGHVFSPSNESFGPMPEYFVQNMFEWPVSPARDINEKIS